MLLKECAKCKKLIPYGNTYCNECEPIAKAEQEKRREQSKSRSNKRYNKSRDPKYTKFYNSKAWKVLSRRYAQDKNFRCEECGSIATEVHHKEFIQSQNGWNRRLDYGNLELLCVNCHNKKHNRFIKKELY